MNVELRHLEFSTSSRLSSACEHLVIPDGRRQRLRRATSGCALQPTGLMALIGKVKLYRNISRIFMIYYTINATAISLREICDLKFRTIEISKDLWAIWRAADEMNISIVIIKRRIWSKRDAHINMNLLNFIIFIYRCEMGI